MQSDQHRKEHISGDRSDKNSVPIKKHLLENMNSGLISAKKVHFEFSEKQINFSAMDRVSQYNEDDAEKKVLI